MNKKALIAIICAAVVIIAGGAGFVLTRTSDNNTTTTTESQTQVTESTSQTEAQTSETETSSTETTVKTEAYPFIKQSVWYLYDDANRVAYAFKFEEEDDDDVIVAYFGEDNINGEDAKYSKNEADYRIEGDKIIITDLPNSYDVKSFTLTVSGETLKSEDGTELEKQSDLKLEYPFDHFNA